ncbi:MAG: endonuclease/exonuclease/phosphatase family protein [Francisellaceae bacterium]
MLKPDVIIQSCQGRARHTHVPNQFKLVSWNIYKINHKNPIAFERYINQLHNQCEIEFYLLQEAKHSDTSFFPLTGFCLNFAANLKLRKHAYGVLTASNINCDYAYHLLSEEREFLLRTHKSTLVNHYFFADGTPLIIANIHAINFKNSKAYEKELQLLHESLQDYGEVPMIIAGDFNCWNKKRNHLIRQLTRQLKLIQVDFEDKHHIKRFAKHPLDLVLYKNLICLVATAIDSEAVSDHNPLLLKFSKL